MRIASRLAVLTLISTPALAGPSFVNWETPHVHPIALTPDGAQVLAVNTADNRLEVFDVTGGTLAHVASIPTGLDPVSVRVRTDTEAWVVNHVSDSISVVDLTTGNVTATILTGDEPADVCFAGAPPRAFVTMSQLNEVWVYDADAPNDAAPIVLAIEGEDPRALATDGTRVFAAIFESGNDTTIVPEATVDSGVNPYPGNANPPPNDGLSFDPPIAGGLTTPPGTGMIVRRDAGGWSDANGFDWSAAVTWDLHGHDVAVIDATTLGVTYVNALMNLDMAIEVSPAGQVVVVGTEAINDVRFEPNLNATFVRVMGASFDVASTTADTIVDLNPHLDYTTTSVPMNVREQSIGDPRGVAFSASGDRVFVTGMGSNNIVELDASLSRVGRIEVGEGPTGVVHDDSTGMLYTLNKFDASVSVVDTSSFTEIARVPFYDPTPAIITTGRPHLYDTHATSGLGQASCASCHIDGRMDQVSWDLGDPQGAMKAFNQTCNFGLGGCVDWHPMKGPMTTQTLVGLEGTGPLHWRADREDLGAFNPAFVSLLGADAELSDPAMAEFEAFVMTMTYPPNPYRPLDNVLDTNSPFGGSPVMGFDLYTTVPLDGGALTCVACHTFTTGTNGQLTNASALQSTQDIKIPQLRNMHEKTGFDMTSANNNRGFGYRHDGAVDTLFSFLEFDGFDFPNGGVGDVQRTHLISFMMAFSTDTHAGVGAQATIDGSGDQIARRDELVAIADAGEVGLVAKGFVGGALRGYVYLGGNQFQSDRAADTVSVTDLDAVAGAAATITYTLVPLGSESRIGVDRDEDGFLDADETDACADPADPTSTPRNSVCCAEDLDGDGIVGFGDIVTLLAAWGPCGDCEADIDGSGDVGFSDLVAVLGAWGSCS